MLLPFDHSQTPLEDVCFCKEIKLNTEAWGILLGHATGFAAKNACSIMQQAAWVTCQWRFVLMLPVLLHRFQENAAIFRFKPLLSKFTVLKTHTHINYVRKQALFIFHMLSILSSQQVEMIHRWLWLCSLSMCLYLF